jgi:hypothetical protein
VAATDRRTCSSKVDLPTPGSPPSNVTEPGTKPPPSTRSSSASPVDAAPPPRDRRRSRATGSTAGGRPIPRAAGDPARSPTTSSTREFHAPQVGASTGPPPRGDPARPTPVHRPLFAHRGRVRPGCVGAAAMPPGPLRGYAAWPARRQRRAVRCWGRRRPAPPAVAAGLRRCGRRSRRSRRRR